MSTVTGEISLNKTGGKTRLDTNHPVGENLPDSFFDSYQEEMLTCFDILNLAGLQSQTRVTITFDRKFLKKIVHSHILFIKQQEK